MTGNLSDSGFSFSAGSPFHDFKKMTNYLYIPRKHRTFAGKYEGVP